MAKNAPLKIYDSCCRTCLCEKSDVMINIFNFDNAPNLVKILNSCTTLNIQEDDALPKNICEQCYKCLISFYEFKKLAENVDVQLKDIYDTDKIKSNHKEYMHNDIKVKSEEINDNDSFKFKTELKQEVDNGSRDTLHETNDKLNIYECEFCKKKFRNKSKLEQHRTQHYKKLNKLDKRIADCEKLNGDVPASITESQANKLDEKFVCELCSISFKSLNSLSAHKRKHIQRDRILSCSVCSKVFKKVSHLKRHELTHASNHPYKCALCFKTFALESRYMEHINKHNGIKTHVCLLCEKAFSHLSTLKAHMSIHTKKRPYLCPTCGKSFHSSTNLNQHIKRHIGLKSFVCSLCPKQFVSKGELKSHTQTHTGEPACACDQCGVTFTSRSSLKKHKLRHLGIKPHQCDICPMKFTSKDHLTRHYRIHTGEKPYRCDICNKAYTQSNDLLKHRRVHLGDKLYKCSQCTESFRLKTELRHHTSQHYISSQFKIIESMPNSKDINTESTQNDIKKDLH